ncbi:MAG: hypothetical protein JKY26_01445 [Pseudomonas sp.]|nr:hypothetical protein [Pseudomonas sp.]
MEVNNEVIMNIERTLGSIDGKLDAMEKHNKEFRELQEKNNEAIWKKLEAHDVRIRHNETNLAKKAGLISAATGVGIALISEAIKQGLGS